MTARSIGLVVFGGMLLGSIAITGAALVGWLPRSLWPIGIVLATSTVFFFALFRIATRRAQGQPVAQGSVGQLLEPMSGIMLMRYVEQMNEMALAPVMFMVKLFWSVVAFMLLLLIVGWEPATPFQDWLLPIVVLTIGCVGIPIAFVVGYLRTLKLELRCPKCRALIVGLVQAGTYEQVRRSGACPKCSNVILKASTAADTIS